jgi:23S rRNA (cytidine1920-2'-O)/16S rRNA (cytidine1409-2'-O)-methyltransferase
LAPKRKAPRLVPLAEALRAQHPGLAATDAAAAVAEGRVTVDGRPVLGLEARVPATSPVVVAAPPRLRGSAKLAGALDHFGVAAAGRVALDAGAAAGGFTAVLLERQAARVYAVDAGHGQLRGTLRQDPRVVCLERTNLADLDRNRVPEPVDLVTLDLSYLSLAAAVPQLERVAVASGADLVALVKPMFELALPEPPTDPARLRDALHAARDAIARGPWDVVGHVESAARGARGTIEYFVHARRGR